MGRRPIATLLSDGQEPLASLLADVLRDLEVDLDLGAAGEVDPDLVLVAVDVPGGIYRLTEAARRFAGRTPVVAILPFHDDRVAQRALQLGAAVCYPLDTPLDGLRSALGTLLAGRRLNGTAR